VCVVCVYTSGPSRETLANTVSTTSEVDEVLIPKSSSKSLRYLTCPSESVFHFSLSTMYVKTFQVHGKITEGIVSPG
jgi:hypothetical protein